VFPNQLSEWFIVNLGILFLYFYIYLVYFVICFYTLKLVFILIYFLFLFLGIEPCFQARGVGKALLNTVLKWADEQVRDLHLNLSLKMQV
jgi:GNAT superfamily N-acetyltransferase